MPALVLVVLSLLVMVGRVAAPLGQRAEGQELLVVRLGPRERMLYHRTGLYAFGVILLLLALTGLLRYQFQILAIVACYGVLTAPVRYRLTTTGLGVNGVVFRRWPEFCQVETSAHAITLHGTPGNGRFTLRLLRANQTEALRVIERQLHLPAALGGKVAGKKRGGKTINQSPARNAR